jgi:succinate dehydrogenase / fumarate reductase membrane anchor subunit
MEALSLKKTLTVSHSGTGWWLAQRISAVVMLIVGMALFMGYLRSPAFDYESWRAAFEYIWIKHAVWLLVASLCLHAWAGLREVLMDYVKPLAMRLSLNVIVAITLILSVVWTTAILWGVNG